MLHLLLAVVIVWTTLSFLDIIFKSCLFYPYVYLLQKSGISLKPCFIRFYITYFNRKFLRWGNYKPHFLRRWFDFGTAFICVFIPVAFGLVLVSFIQMISAYMYSKQESQILQPVVPGVTLPSSQIAYYLIVFSVVSVFHELGHALAAVREGIHIEGCGFFIFVLIPGAFVDLPKEKISYLSPWQQLRIFSAGVWHNIFLSCFAVLLLVSNIILLSPLFQQHSGVTVIDVIEKSGAAGPAGLHGGDHISSVNNCMVKDLESWKGCLRDIALNPQSGYCVKRSFLKKSSFKSTENMEAYNCCKNFSSELCFKYFNEDLKVNELACLPVRELLNTAVPCNNTSSYRFSDGVYLVPVFESSTDRLIQIMRKNEKSVLFVGPTAELFSSVTLSSWVPKFKLASVYLVHVYETLLKYIISFSGAVALLNIIPCPGLDGQWLCQILVEKLLFSAVPKRSHRKRVSDVIIIIGGILIILTVLIGVINIMYKI